jgi:phosphatidate cytidylyltransferase
LGSARWTSFALLGAGLNIAAQIGDFFESALKRWRGVKDSGRILPGHGGIMDRIDSLLFTLPLYCGLAALFPFFA